MNKKRTTKYVRTLQFKDKYRLGKYLEDNSHNGKIDQWPHSIAQSAGLFLKLDVAPSTITAMCKDMGIALKNKGTHGASRISELAGRINKLERVIDYLIDVCCTDEEKRNCPGNEDNDVAHGTQPLLEDAEGEEV